MPDDLQISDEEFIERLEVLYGLEEDVEIKDKDELLSFRGGYRDNARTSFPVLKLTLRERMLNWCLNKFRIIDKLRTVIRLME